MSRYDFQAELPELADLSPVHMIGIGGVGMAGIARILHAKGVQVAGSDAKDSPEVRALRAAGLTVTVGHDGGVAADTRTVVVTSAVKDDNPELQAARAAGLRVLHRSQALGVLSRASQTLAIAGANGKTTTSSLASFILLHTGQEPSFAIGGTLVATGSNGRAGTSPFMVVEADESDGSFVVYRPQVAVVTNVQPDHLDHYGTFENVVAAYRDFVRSIQPGGTLVACADDPGSAELATWARSQGVHVITYGFAADAEARLSEVVAEGMSSRAALTWQGASYPLVVPIPGAHNVLNAAAALIACSALTQAPLADTVPAVASFTGVGRRFESHGCPGGVFVVDDYAHNPPKVAAVISAARQAVERGRVIVLFQPHLFSRTRDFADEFAQALSTADVVIMLDVYGAREERFDNIAGTTISSRIHAFEPRCEVVDVPDARDAVRTAVALARPGDMILTVGAGDITALAPQLVAALDANGSR